MCSIFPAVGLNVPIMGVNAFATAFPLVDRVISVRLLYRYRFLSTYIAVRVSTNVALCWCQFVLYAVFMRSFIGLLVYRFAASVSFTAPSTLTEVVPNRILLSSVRQLILTE